MSLYGGIKFSLADDSASSGIARNGKDDGKDGNASSGMSTSLAKYLIIPITEHGSLILQDPGSSPSFRRLFLLPQIRTAPQ